MKKKEMNGDTLSKERTERRHFGSVGSQDSRGLMRASVREAAGVHDMWRACVKLDSHLVTVCGQLS